MSKRIHKEIKIFANEKPEYVKHMYVDNKNTNNVYFLVCGPGGTPFEGGEYVVYLSLPKDYPMKPPRLQVRTPNGRFETNVDICASFTSYHPESWSPIQNFCTIMRSFVSFLTDKDTGPFIGQVISTEQDKITFARESKDYNMTKGLSKMFL